MEDLYLKPALRSYEKLAEAGKRLSEWSQSADDETRRCGKEMKVVGFPQNGGSVPSVRVAGQWLERFGFRLGDTVTLTADEGRIVITRRKEE